MITMNNREPQSSATFLAPSATLVGEVFINSNSSIWYGAILRADKNEIFINQCVSIQDGVIITTDYGDNQYGRPNKVFIDSNTQIGHGAKLHCCEIGAECVIGMNATILQGAVIGRGAVIAAGAIVPPYTKIPEQTVWGGKPLREFRKIGFKENKYMVEDATKYEELAMRHAEQFTTYTTQYRDLEDDIAKLQPRITMAPPLTDAEEAEFRLRRDYAEEFNLDEFEQQMQRQRIPSDPRLQAEHNIHH